MYEIRHANKFRKSYKKIVSSVSFDPELFERLISYLARGVELPVQFHDHALQGNMLGSRVCHMKGDCLLVYEIREADEVVLLVDIGNHANVLRM